MTGLVGGLVPGVPSPVLPSPLKQQSFNRKGRERGGMLAHDLLTPLSPGQPECCGPTQVTIMVLSAGLPGGRVPVPTRGGQCPPPPSTLSPQWAACHVMGLNKDEGWDRGTEEQTPCFSGRAWRCLWTDCLSFLFRKSCFLGCWEWKV